ncbi:hypothetical protein RXV94_11480 [Yeosuana sp. MJ-SS3]|uniref:DUF1934 domain-containing protein n=1 Tax=Gilvirhabdus luticola TaxID=3079858 RepID=A0ABU3U8Y3_9FLAO|nr:hypothetical protein [Yeosuana sp. MJ-SS3]MDU8886784.1 hypothetical protein [Yeosuana sp. MJ-SS3]
MKKDSFELNQDQTVATQCPEDGNCTFEVLENKSLEKLKGSLGESYYKVVEGKNLLLRFQYERNQIPNTVDGHYIEQVFVELDKNNLEVELNSVNSKKIRVVFARFCYCKGQTGYYDIDKGSLIIKKVEGNKYQLDFYFKITEVPQIITEIHEIFTLN